MADAPTWLVARGGLEATGVELFVILIILVVVVIGPRRFVGWLDRVDDIRRAVRGAPRISRAERERGRSFASRLFLKLDSASPLGWATLIAGIAIIILELSFLHWGAPLLILGAILLFVAPWLL